VTITAQSLTDRRDLIDPGLFDRLTRRAWSRPRCRARPIIRALLSAIRDRRPGLVDDVEDALAVHLARQQVIYQPGHEFTVVLEENVLRHRIGGTGALREQLAHLRAAMAVPSVRLGIIPFTADRSPLRPVEMFFMFDAEVQAELVSGWLRVTQPTEIGMYAQAFTRLSQMAAHGQGARALVGRALRELP
jgi:hypothetical protein